MRRFLATALPLVLAACSHGGSNPSATPSGAGATLEAAAVATGVIADPNSTDVTGLYALDTERLCLVPAQKAFRIGISIDYGDGQHCSAAGMATHDGETLHIALAGAPGCRFDARFGGDRVALPGDLPAACDAVCTGRASLEGMAVPRLSDSLSEAAAMRDVRGRLLCGDAQ
jgi:hypothetical protein